MTDTCPTCGRSKDNPKVCSDAFHQPKELRNILRKLFHDGTRAGINIEATDDDGEDDFVKESEAAMVDWAISLSPKALRTNNKINRTDSDGHFLVAPSEAYNQSTDDFITNIKRGKKV